MTENLPPGGKILNFQKGRNPAVTENNNVPQGDEPPVREFDFHLTDGSIYEGKGHLLVTTAFVGVGQSDGSISFVVPLTQLFYVERIEADVPAAETA